MCNYVQIKIDRTRASDICNVEANYVLQNTITFPILYNMQIVDMMSYVEKPHFLVVRRVACSYELPVIG